MVAARTGSRHATADFRQAGRRGTQQHLQQQIVRQITTLIENGMLRPRDPLPATRELSAQLGVARNTVVLAYQALAREGFVETFGRSGTRVGSTLPRAYLNARGRLSKTADVLERTPEPTHLEQWRNASLYDPSRNHLRLDFRIGRPDRSLFPHRIWKRLVEQRLHGAPLALTEYGDPLGLGELRGAIAERVRVSRGIQCSAEQVLIVAGVQEGLNLVSRACCYNQGPWPLSRIRPTLEQRTCSRATARPSLLVK